MAIKNISDIEKLLKLEDGSIKKAFEDENEVEIEIPKLQFFTEDELKKRETVIQRKHYKEGEIAKEEMLTKYLKDELGLEFDGKKFDLLFENHKAKVLEEAKIDIEPKLLAKDKELKKFKDLFKQKSDEFDAFKETSLKKEEQMTLAEKKKNAIPDGKYNLSKNEMLALFGANGYSVENIEGTIITKKNGEQIDNEKTKEPESLDVIMKGFIEEKKFAVVDTGGDGGRGKGDEGGQATLGSLKDFDKRMEAKDIVIGSEQYNKEMGKEIKEGTLKV